MTQISSQRRRSEARIASKPGPFRKPATVMNATMPLCGGCSKTFHAAQRQK